jgi:hypothetical protein
MTMKVWITKYALSDGIFVRDVETTRADGMVFYPGDGSIGSQQAFHGEGKDWHRTPEAALQRAEAMRLAKIASLKKSIKKLESMSITAPRA